jgi:DNA-binding PadR family transcriptional regulator
MVKEKYGKSNNLHDIPLMGPSTEKMFQPTMLVFVCQKPTHGYELIQELGKHGFAEGEIEPATVYRHLRRMEEAGFVKSRWDTGGSGPARRLYEITPEGLEHLRAWGDLLKRRKEKLEEFLSLFDEVMAGAGVK